MCVPQAHLTVSWLARERLSMAAWAVMASGRIVRENVGGSPFYFRGAIHVSLPRFLDIFIPYHSTEEDVQKGGAEIVEI